MFSLCVSTVIHIGDSIHGWTLAEQDAWIAAPDGDPMFRDCIGVVDATYIRIERPKDYIMERRYYSTYKKYHAMFFLAIIDRHQSLRLLADVAYTYDDLCRCPYKAPYLTVEQAGSADEATRRRIYNQRLSRTRQRVEHAFSRLKHTFRLMQSTWNLPLDTLPDAFLAAALLCNWLHRERNLYTIDD